MSEQVNLRERKKRVKLKCMEKVGSLECITGNCDSNVPKSAPSGVWFEIRQEAVAGGWDPQSCYILRLSSL